MRRAIGYWFNVYGPEGSHLPDPRRLVDEGEPTAERRQRDERIARYLDDGVRINEELGFSYCRFDPDHDVGTCDQTDGTWVWPERLSHYVLEHRVRLPEEFVAFMEAADWQVPPEVEPSDEVSFDFWLEWSAPAIPQPGDELMLERQRHMEERARKERLQRLHGAVAYYLHKARELGADQFYIQAAPEALTAFLRDGELLRGIRLLPDADPRRSMATLAEAFALDEPHDSYVYVPGRHGEPALLHVEAGAFDGDAVLVRIGEAE